MPVPLSPRISTVAESFAIFCTSSTMSRVILLGPTMNSRSVWSATWADSMQDLAVQVLPVARVLHQGAQLVVVEVLCDVVVSAVLHGLHGGFDLGDGRDHEDLDQAVVLLDDPEDFEAADARQPDVEQHQVDVFAVQDGKGGLAGRDPQHAVIALQDGRERIAHPLVVVDHKHGLGFLTHQGCGRGIVAGG